MILQATVIRSRELYIHIWSNGRCTDRTRFTEAEKFNTNHKSSQISKKSRIHSYPAQSARAALVCASSGLQITPATSSYSSELYCLNLHSQQLQQSQSVSFWELAGGTLILETLETCISKVPTSHACLLFISNKSSPLFTWANWGWHAGSDLPKETERKNPWPWCLVAHSKCHILTLNMEFKTVLLAELGGGKYLRSYSLKRIKKQQLLSF